MKKESKTPTNTETAEDRAEQWVGWLRNDIAFLDAFKDYPIRDVDRRRAVWGRIIALLSGDAINGLNGANMLIESNMSSSPSSEDQYVISFGMKSTWPIYQKTVTEFGNRLPIGLQQKFQEIFETYGGFVQDVITGQTHDFPHILRVNKKLHRAMTYEIREDPRVIQEGYNINIDCHYSLSVLEFIQHTKDKGK